MPVAEVGVSKQTGTVQGVSTQIGYKTTYIVLLKDGYIFETNNLPMPEKDIEGKEISFELASENEQNGNKTVYHHPQGEIVKITRADGVEIYNKETAKEEKQGEGR